MSGLTTENTEDTEAEQKYRLTPLGLLLNYTSEEQAKEIVDAIELYMRRNGFGMAVIHNELDFVKMRPVEEEAE